MLPQQRIDLGALQAGQGKAETVLKPGPSRGLQPRQGPGKALQKVAQLLHQQGQESKKPKGQDKAQGQKYQHHGAGATQAPRLQPVGEGIAEIGQQSGKTEGPQHGLEEVNESAGRRQR